MAPPHFSMYSPKSPEDGAGANSEPVFGATSGDDPGYFASLRSGTVLGGLRIMMLVLVAAPVLILAISPLIVQGDGLTGAGDAPLWPYVPPIIAALAVALIAPRVPGPLTVDPGAAPGAVARVSVMQYRQAVLLRFALSEAVILIGLPLAIAGESVLVFAMGFVLGYPLLIGLALPTRGGVERIRRRLEARGIESHLWAALLAPLPGRGEAAPRDDAPRDDAPQDDVPGDGVLRDGAPQSEQEAREKPAGG